MLEVVLSPRVSVIRTCTPSRMPLAARQVNNARRTSALEGTSGKVIFCSCEGYELGRVGVLHARRPRSANAHNPSHNHNPSHSPRTLEVHGLGGVHEPVQVLVEVEDPPVVDAKALPHGVPALHDRIQDADLGHLPRQQAVPDPHQDVQILRVRCQSPRQPVVGRGGAAAARSRRAAVSCVGGFVGGWVGTCVSAMAAVNQRVSKKKQKTCLSVDGRMAWAEMAS